MEPGIPEGASASADVNSGASTSGGGGSITICLPTLTNARKMTMKSQEEFQERRLKHARRFSNKIGKTFQQLENSLPEHFIPKEKTKEAILEQTKKYARMMETQLAAAPSTALCLICDTPRIACGCTLPDFLRKPMGQADSRMENYIKDQMVKAGLRDEDDLSE